MIISSKDNETIKEIRKLKYKKYRKNKFIVEGIKMLQEAINENQNIELIVIKDGININLDLSNYQIINVTDNVFNSLTDVISPQGVLAIINKKSNVEINKNADYIIALDGIQDPGNMGTILRTLDSAGIHQVIVSKDTVDCYSPKVVRSTMGSIYRINIIEVDRLKETLQDLKNNDFEIVVTSLHTNDSIYNINYSKKIVVIGNEANGVSKEIIDISDKKVKIPMLGKTESLNASVATGIMIYEYVRQKLNNNNK